MIIFKPLSFQREWRITSGKWGLIFLKRSMKFKKNDNKKIGVICKSGFP